MRELRNDPKRLQDILQAIDTIFQYVDGYHNVEEDLVWEAIAVDLHPIREKIVKYLDEIGQQ